MSSYIWKNRAIKNIFFYVLYYTDTIHLEIRSCIPVAIPQKFSVVNFLDFLPVGP